MSYLLPIQAFICITHRFATHLAEQNYNRMLDDIQRGPVSKFSARAITNCPTISVSKDIPVIFRLFVCRFQFILDLL